MDSQMWLRIHSCFSLALGYTKTDILDHMNRTALGTSLKWSQTVVIFSCLAYFTQCNPQSSSLL